jgi:hypothetical protein
VIASRKDGTRLALGLRALVGRAPHALVRLASPTVSGEHARLAWQAGAWQLRDLASTNGTWLEGERLTTQAAVPLHRGSRFAFGDPDERWLLADDGPPEAQAVRVGDGFTRHPEQGLVVLGDTACVFADKHGWWLDIDGERRNVHDQEIVLAGGDSWRLDLPPLDAVIVQITKNLEPLRVASAVLRFCVSRDEESVELNLITPGQVVALGHKTHHYLLHVLALERVHDRERGAAGAEAPLPPAEQGWVHVSELSRRLRLAPEHINVAIWRARQALRQHGFVDPEAIVERRARTGQVRIGGAAWSWAGEPAPAP